MERKYYLRGLGLGIVVTAVIMGIALSGNKAVTDSEIIARAKELGMVENSVLSDAGKEEEAQENTDTADSEGADGQNQTMGDGQDIAQADRDEVQNTAAADSEIQSGNGAQGNDETSDDVAAGSDTVDDLDTEKADAESALNTEGEGTSTVADDEESGESEDDNTGITVGVVRVITVNSGDSSYVVAKKLADVGVVTSAETFDTFLCENGYDKKIRTGTFSIPADASDEQIARIVSGLE